jgi:hypothetical protein
MFLKTFYLGSPRISETQFFVRFYLNILHFFVEKVEISTPPKKTHFFTKNTKNVEIHENDQNHITAAPATEVTYNNDPIIDSRTGD